jgi:hypothetical protein
MTDEPNTFDQPNTAMNSPDMNPLVGSGINVELQRKAGEEAQKAADAKKADEDAKKDGPVVHGEHAQRYVNKTSRHSERYENHP